MEAVELARQCAAAMHDAAIAGGADPWDPIEIVMAVAADKGLDVEPVEAGSPILAGGRAHFDPSNRAIRHEDAGDAFARAFLSVTSSDTPPLATTARSTSLWRSIPPVRPRRRRSGRTGSLTTADDSGARSRWISSAAN